MSVHMKMKGVELEQDVVWALPAQQAVMNDEVAMVFWECEKKGLTSEAGGRILVQGYQLKELMREDPTSVAAVIVPILLSQARAGPMRVAIHAVLP